MKERIVSFEIAKLANTLGFNHIKANCYGDNLAYSSKGNLIYANKGNIVEGYILAPTQSLLQKWIRKVHNIHIEIFLSDQTPYNTYYYRIMEIGKYFTLSYNDRYNTNFEDELEIALVEALNLINN